ncbi:hypothetical protein ACC782_33545 [Rhizobium ruizarguesonis]
MPTPKLSDELAQEAADAFDALRSKTEAALLLGISRTTFNDRLKIAAERGMCGTKPVLPGFAIKSIASKTEDGAWVKQTREHGEIYATPEGHLVKGESALVDAEGRIIQKWIKTKQDSVTEDLVTAIKAAFGEYIGKAELIDPPAHTDADLLSVYPIADQHNGLLAWSRDAGESYDLKIGSSRLLRCMSRLVAQSPRSKQALILNLGDWQHTDDQKNMTPRSGNLLDVDGRYFKVLTTGVQLMMDCIELALQKHESVLVRNIPGNHDPHASIALTVALSAFYHNNPRVTIDDDPSDFFFYRFGATLIGANHGHKMRAPEMAMTMAVRRREDWGLTKFHWFLFGHIHHETAKEIGDVRVESFQTLAAKDAHAHSSGYNSGQSLNSITLHIEEGEIGRHRIQISPVLVAANDNEPEGQRMAA